MTTVTTLEVGDYVVATKYHDGDPGDHFAVGFIAAAVGLPDRHLVVDSVGQPFRANGFRRARRITAETGATLVAMISAIESGGRSVWDIVDDIEARKMPLPCPP